MLLIPAPFVYRRKLQPYVPYGLLSLQAVARECGGEVDILAFSEVFSGRALESSDELVRGVADFVHEKKYEVVGLSTMCSSFHHSLGIAIGIKRLSPRLKVWMGGPHASVAPGLVLERFPEIDAVFVGEGEVSFRDLLVRPPGPLGALVAELPGVRSRYSSFLSRRPLANLDELPFIDQARDFLSTFTSSEDAMYRGIPLEAERGCPGRCTFCSTRLYWGNRVRYKSDRRMITEMDRLHTLTGKRLFSLIGDNLAASRRRLLAFCESMRREASDYRWVCSLKPDGLQIEDLDPLWAGGCRGLFVGVESGSQDTLDRVGKGVDLRRLVRLLYEAIDKGFSINTSLIVGFPWETSSDLKKTYKLHADLLKRGVRHSHVVALCPLPGTDLERSHSDLIQQGKSRSRVASDDLPYGVSTLSLMERCPELFRQFGCFETKNVDEIEVNAIMQAARTLSNHYGHLKSELVST